MEYKVLIKLYLPEIEESYEAYIPLYKTVAEVSGLLNQMAHSMADIFPILPTTLLYNRRTGVLYDQATLIVDTDIRNGTELVMIAPGK